MPKNKKFKPIPYRDFPSSTDRIPQPKGKFVDIFKVMQERHAKAEREAEANRSRKQAQTSNNQSAGSATPTETNPMPKNKKRRHLNYTDLTRTHDEIPQPKGKFVNPFKAMRDGWAAAEKEADVARSRRQDQTSE